MVHTTNNRHKNEFDRTGLDHFRTGWCHITYCDRMHRQGHSPFFDLFLLWKWFIIPTFIIMTYGLIFWRKSPDIIKIFRLQKKIIRIVMGCRRRDSCRKFFLNLGILPLPSQYILSLLLFMIRKKNQFQVNSEIHQINTRQHANLDQPSVNATKYQKGVHCIGVKVFNTLPFYIKAESDNQKKNLNYCYKNTYVKIPFIHWLNILNSKVKFWHMIWIDTWGLWDTCSFSLLTSLYYKYVSIYPTTICNKGKFPI